jgi:hypothetical protein
MIAAIARNVARQNARPLSSRRITELVPETQQSSEPRLGRLISRLIYEPALHDISL